MNSWSPLWSMIVDSSIWGEPDYVCKIFITMLALKDADHVVRLNAYQLGQRARKPEEEVIRALKILSSPDKRRLEEQEFEGRRIEKVADGWLILNGQKYRDKIKQLRRREYKAEWQKGYRNRKKALPGEKAYVAAEKAGASAAQLGALSEPVSQKAV